MIPSIAQAAPPTTTAIKALEGFYHYLLESLPTLGKMAAILTIGLLSKVAITALFRWLSKRIALDERTQRHRLYKKLARLQLKASPSALIERLLSWLVLGTTAYALAREAGFEALSLGISALAAFTPKLAAAALLLFGGLFLAEIVERLSLKLLKQRQELNAPALLAKVIYYAILVLSMTLAAEQLALDLSLIHGLITITVGATLLAAGLTLTLSGVPIFKRRFARLYISRSFKLGDHLHIGALSGTLIQLGDLVMVLEDHGQRHLIPYDVVLRSRITRDPAP